MNAFAVVCDSGTLPEEELFTSIGRPFPAVCIRTSTERPEALDKAALSWRASPRAVLQAVDTAVEMEKRRQRPGRAQLCGQNNVSTKVVKLIQSYWAS